MMQALMTQTDVELWYEHEVLDGASKSSQLLSMVQCYDWAGALARLASKPSEARIVGMQGRTPLHVACDHDAPLVVVEALLKVYPQATTMVGTTGMNPLHITCSSQHASTKVIHALLERGYLQQASMQDVDGDTPLHAACRCGAPTQVLETLLRAYPQAVDLRDAEGLTPLHRLWVRYFVMLGDNVIHDIRSSANLTGELGEAWQKTQVLLRYSYLKEYLGTDLFYQPFSVVHAAATVDCPRDIVRIATSMERKQLGKRDMDGNTPLLLAAKAPVFKVRDLSDDGYCLEQYDGCCCQEMETEEEEEDSIASVMDILLSLHHCAASMPDRTLRLPLHWALAKGKKWNQGVESLIHAYPESLISTDETTGLQPFMMAAMSKQSGKSDLNTVYEILRTNPMALYSR